MNYKYIYLIFSKTGTWLSQVINVFSDTKYIHTSLSFDSTFTEMYSFGRTNPDNPFSGGFVKESLYEGVYKKFPQCECLIYKVRITEEQYFNLRQALKEFEKNKYKYKYNFIGLFGVLFNIPLKRRRHYFCTQFVSELLEKSKICHFDKSPELMRPTDLFNIANKEIIFQGLINNNYSLLNSFKFVI